MGNAWYALGDKEKARQAWLEGSRFRASKFMPANQYLQRNLAESFAESGDNELARHHTGLMHYETGLLAWRENDLRRHWFPLPRQSISCPCTQPVGITWPRYDGQKMTARGRVTPTRNASNRTPITAVLALP